MFAQVFRPRFKDGLQLRVFHRNLVGFRFVRQQFIGREPGFVGFARLEGRVIGVVANNPQSLGGVLFVDSADKAARFINQCDAFNIPLLFLAACVVMILGRFIPIIGPLAIAGSLASKKYIPESAGTLKVDSIAFNAVLLSVIIIVAALSFFPALTLGPLAEYFSLSIK